MDVNDFIHYLIKDETINNPHQEDNAREVFTAFDTLSNAVNSSTLSQKVFNRAFVQGVGHRTLQQSTFRFMMGLIEYMASEEYGRMTDGRNIDSHNKAKQLVEIYKEKFGYSIAGGISHV